MTKLRGFSISLVENIFNKFVRHGPCADPGYPCFQDPVPRPQQINFPTAYRKEFHSVNDRTAYSYPIDTVFSCSLFGIPRVINNEAECDVQTVLAFQT